jgi:hypothetical protein
MSECAGMEMIVTHLFHFQATKPQKVSKGKSRASGREGVHMQLSAGRPLAYAWHLGISKSESCPCGENERLCTFNRCALLRAGLLGGLPTHGTWRYPRVSHTPVDKTRDCVPSTGVHLTGGSGGRPRTMHWVLVSEREANGGEGSKDCEYER